MLDMSQHELTDANVVDKTYRGRYHYDCIIYSFGLNAQEDNDAMLTKHVDTLKERRNWNGNGQ